MMVPQAIILDPATTLATPLPLFLSTGMKAIDHAAERLTSLRVEPLTEALATQALRLLSRGLPRVLENPADLDTQHRTSGLRPLRVDNPVFVTAILRFLHWQIPRRSRTDRFRREGKEPVFEALKGKRDAVNRKAIITPFRS
jgi:hypothetical protein